VSPAELVVLEAWQGTILINGRDCTLNLSVTKKPQWGLHRISTAELIALRQGLFEELPEV